MRFALRTAMCCATVVAALWPTKAIGDEATLKRTAPDECIAWFSWAGLDALAKEGAKTNRTKQLLADEEVRAFLDSLAKNLGGAIAENSDENTKLTAQLARILSKRPAVAFLSRLAEVKRDTPPKAPEPPLTPPQAAVWPTPKVTIGEDGLERIGIDFDVQVTAHDMPAAPVLATNFGRTRKVIVDGKARTEIEVQYPGGARWEEIEVDFDFDLDDNVPTPKAGRSILASAYDLPVIGGYANAIDAAIWAAQQAEACNAPNLHSPPHVPSFAAAAINGPHIIPKGVNVPAPNTPVCLEYAQPGAEFTAQFASTYPSPAVASPCGTDCLTCTTCDAATKTTVMHGAVVVDLGEHAAELKTLYDKLAAESGELLKKRINDVEFAKLGWDQPMWLAFHDGYLILAFDEGSAAQCVSGIAGKREVPKWLVDAEAKLPVERPAARLHVNIDGITKLVDEPFEEPSKEFVKLLGLDQVSAISFVAGLDDQGTAVKTLIATRDGANVSAVLDFFGDKGLSADDLKAIPKDATMAAAGKIDVKKIVEVGVKLALLEDDEAESAWDATEKYLAEHLFIDWSKDIVEAIGDTWTLHYAPSEGGLMATTFTLAVRDEARLKSALEKLSLAANAENAYVRKFTYRGQDVYYFQGGDVGGSAAWCIRDGRLVASMLPQTIKAHIARGALKETLADVPEVKRTLTVREEKTYPGYKPKPGPLMLSYTDTRGILQWCYQYGSFALPAIGQQLSQSDVTLALHEFPSLAVIEQYFAPSITTVSRTEGGLLIDSRQTVPMMSGVLALSTLASVEGLGLDSIDPGDLVDFSGSIVQLPLGISMDSPIGMRNVGIGHAAPVVSGDCVSGECTPYPAVMPSPYRAASPATAYAPMPPALPGALIRGAVAPAPPAPAATPKIESGPGVGGPGPGVFVPYAPNSTPVPYAPSAVGGPYVPPPATPPNRPATYQSPYSPYATPPAPAGGPYGTPIGFPTAPAAAPNPQPASPGYSYPKAQPAPAVPSAPYGGKEHPNPPLSKPVPAESSPSNATQQKQPDVAYPYYETRGPRDLFEPDPGVPVADSKCAACAKTAQVTASDQPAEQIREYGVPFGDPKDKLFRRVTESPNERKIRAVDMLAIELIQGTPKAPYRIEPFDTLQIVADGTPDDSPVAGEYVVDPGGFVHLGEAYGRLRVKDLTIAKARDAIESSIRTKAPAAKVSTSIAQTVFQRRVSDFRSLNPEGSLVIGSDSVKVDGLSLDAAKTKIEEMLSKQLDSPEIELAFAFDVEMNEISEEPAAEFPNHAKPVDPAVWAKDFRLHHYDVVTIASAMIAPKASHKLAPGDQFGLTIAKDANSAPFETTDEVREDGSIDLGDEFGVVPVAGRTVAEARDLIRLQVRKTSPNARTVFELSICQQRDVLMKDYPIQDTGTIDLGKYGQANVVGCTLPEARSRIEAKLEEHYGDAEVQLDVTPKGTLTKTGARKGFTPAF